MRIHNEMDIREGGQMKVIVAEITLMYMVQVVGHNIT